MNILHSIRRYFAFRRLSIILDPRDNSVTFDPPLVRHMDILSQSQAFIYTFRVKHKVRHWLLPFLSKGTREYYAFALNPPSIDPQSDFVAQVQVDDSTGDIGYECLCPGVSRIAYDLGLPTTLRSRLAVIPHRTKGKDAFTYYRIVPPSRFAASKLPSTSNDEILHSEFSQSLIHEANKDRLEELERLRQEAYDRMNKTHNNQ